MTDSSHTPRSLRRIAATCLVSVMAPVVTLGVIAGQAAAALPATAEHVPVSPAPRAQHQVSGNTSADPRTLPALPTVASTGPVATGADGVVLDGSLGLSTSLTPTLMWKAGPGSGISYEVSALDGTRVWSSVGGSQGVRVAAGVLRQGGVYQWKATAGGSVFGPMLLRVDTQRNDVQSMVDFGGVSVATVTGEPATSITTRPMGSVGGDVEVTLSYRPSNAGAMARGAGLPAGWHLNTSADAPWTNLRRVSATRVVMYGNDGVPVPLSEVSPGSWRADFGAGQSWPAGTRAIVAQPVSPTGELGPFQVTDASGTVVTFADPAVGATVHAGSVWSAKSPTVQAAYDQSGRITRLTDPVTGRAVTLSYGGAADCPAPGAGVGLKAAPTGMLCRIHDWAGGVTEIFYRANDGSGGTLGGPKIARVIGDVQAGGQLLAQQDYGYDQTGRLATLRSPITNAAIASGVLSAAGITADNASDPAVLNTITYDSRGRVASITRPAALQAGVAAVPAQARRDFTYSGTGTFQMNDPAVGRPLVTENADVSTMLVSRGTDVAGRVSAVTWDRATQAPVSKTEPGGLVTRYVYDASGRLQSKSGPSTEPSSGSAPRQTEYYDTAVSATSPTAPRHALTGLRGAVWEGTSFSGAPVADSVGPRVGGSTPATLSYTYSRPGGAFSARLEGAIIVPPGGISAITSTVPSQQLWVAGTRCTTTCPDSVDLAQRKPGDLIDVRIDLRSNASGVAGVGVTWTPKTGSAVAIPSTALRPMLPNATATAVRDQLVAGGGLLELANESTFSPSDPVQLTSVRMPSGQHVTRGYEPYAPARGEYGRATTSTGAAGQMNTTTYYKAGEAPAVDCPGVAANQAGLAKHLALPGGLGVTQAYDTAGRLVGQQQIAGRRTCITRDALGREVGQTTTSRDGTTTVRSEPEVDGNPLMSRTTYPGSGRDPETSTTDLLGRLVSTTDTWGTTSTFTYDARGQVTAATTRTAAGEQSTINTSYNIDGTVNQVSRDGTVLATASYQDATGFLTGVDYANGLTVSAGYDTRGNASSRQVSLGDMRYGEQDSTSPAGRTLGRALSGPGLDATWSYAYDKGGHLTRASLAGTVPDGVKAGVWDYAVNAAAQRTRITSPYTSADGYTYAYNAAGAMTATSDPRFASGFAYDASGRATKAGPLGLTYGATGQVTQLDDSAGVREARTYLPSGALIQTAITSAGVTRTSRYTIGGLVTDASGRITSQFVGLPGAVSAQLPPPGSGIASTVWRVGDLAGSTVMEITGDTPPAQLQLFDPDGNRLSGAPLSTDPARPNFGFRGDNTAPLEIPVSHMGAREYVAALGIFLQPDPVPGSATTAYAYANADPVNGSDPSGGFFLFSGAWWKANFIGIIVGTVVAIAVTALTAGLATGPVASLGAALLKGLAVGAVSGAAGDAATQGIEILVGSRQSFDLAQLGTAAVIGAVTGMVSGGVSNRTWAPKRRLKFLNQKLGGAVDDATGGARNALRSGSAGSAASKQVTSGRASFGALMAGDAPYQRGMTGEIAQAATNSLALADDAVGTVFNNPFPIRELSKRSAISSVDSDNQINQFIHFLMLQKSLPG